MTRIRSRRQRPLGFEALEGRLALSTGIGMAGVSHHAAAVVMSQTQRSIPASFKGRVQIPNGSELMITNLSGKIGKDQFTGSGTGTVEGKQFQGGDVFLSNSQGTIHLRLGPAISVKAGKNPRQQVAVVAVESSGKYAEFAGITGTLTTWNVPARPDAVATFSGTFNS